LLSALILIPGALITGRYFDKLLKTKKLPKPSSVGILPFSITNRTVIYMSYILWNGPRKRRWKTYRDQIGDFSFRAYARPIDYILVIANILIVILAIVMLVWILY
jgi:hypothetical protein